MIFSFFNTMRKFLLLTLFTFLIIPAVGQMRLARIFVDHAVLQRRKLIPVWGWAAKNEKITVLLNGQKLSTRTAADGRWRVDFAPMEAGGPHRLMVQGQKLTLTVNDILIGEVWLCSGQSNMEMTVATSDSASVEIKSANYPMIRHFKVPNEMSLQPKMDLNGGGWQICSSKTAGNFSGVGYFFARKIAQTLNVPVGLINASWGGSQLEGWISREGYARSDELRGYLQTMPKTWEEASQQLDKKMKKNVLGSPIAIRTTVDEQRYTAPGYDFSNWPTISLPGQLDWYGAWAFRGQAYLAQTITTSAAVAAESTRLGLGQNEGECTVYINGKQIDKSTIHGKRVLQLPPNTWQTGTNSLILKIGDAKNPDWWGIGVSGLSNDLYLNSPLSQSSLAGNHWKYMPALSEPYRFVQLNNNVGVTLYNGMIEPLIPFAIQGILWYQGETNTERAHQYRKTFPLLIQDWRVKWQDTLPFLFVQLPSYGKSGNSNDGSDWAELREAQAQALVLPKTGMVVTTDIGDANNIHPINKQDVGKRLALNALHIAYGQNITFCGPVKKKVSFGNHKVIVTFSYVGKGLYAKDKYMYVKGFELAGSDKVFHFAKAEIMDNSVEVSSPAVPNPVAVRYAWTNAPVDANLFNKDGLPTAPFRSDNWKGITEENRFQ